MSLEATQLPRMIEPGVRKLSSNSEATTALISGSVLAACSAMLRDEAMRRRER